MSDTSIISDSSKAHDRKEKLKYHKLIVNYTDLLKIISTRHLATIKVSMCEDFEKVTGYYMVCRYGHTERYYYYLFCEELLENAVCDYYNEMEAILEKYKKIIDINF